MRSLPNLPIDPTKLSNMKGLPIDTGGLQKSLEEPGQGASFTGNNEFDPPTYETIYNDYLYANLGKPDNAIIQESLPIIINKLCFQMSSQKEHVISKCDELIKQIGEKENSFENNIDSIVRVKIVRIENLKDKLNKSEDDVNEFVIAVETTIRKIKSKLNIPQNGGAYLTNPFGRMFKRNSTSENSASNDADKSKNAPESVPSSEGLVKLTLTSLNHVTTETDNEKYGSEYIEQLFGSIIMKCKHIIEYKIGSYYDDNFSKTLGLHTVNNHLDQIIDMIRHVLKEKLLTNLAPLPDTEIPATGTRVQQEQSETTKIATAIATAVEQTKINDTNQRIVDETELAKQRREHKDVAMAIAAAVSHSDAIDLHDITLEDKNHTDIAVAVATAATEASTPNGPQVNPPSNSDIQKYTKRVKTIGDKYGTTQTGGNSNIPGGISEPDPNPKQYDNVTWVENLNSVKDYANKKNNELKEYKMSDDSQIKEFINNIGTRIGAIDASDKINRIFDYLKEQIKKQHKLKSSVYAIPLHGMSKISKEATRFMDKNIRPWVNKNKLSSGNYLHLRPNTEYDHEGKSVKYMDENIPIIANNTAIKIADKLDAMDKIHITGLIDTIFSKLSDAVDHHYADNKNESYTKTTIELCIPDYDHRSIFKEIVLQKYRFGIKNRLKLACTALGAAHKTTCSLIAEYCKQNIRSDENRINIIINNIWESVNNIDKNKYGTCYFTRETDETVQGDVGAQLKKNVSQLMEKLGLTAKKLAPENKLPEAVKQFVDAQLKYKSFEAAYNDNSFINIVTSLVQGNKLKSYYLYNVVPDPEYLAEESGNDKGNDAHKKYTVNGDNFKTYMGLVFKAAFETLNKEKAPVEDNNKTFLEAVGEWLPISVGKRIQHKYNRRIRNDITKKKRKSNAIKMRNKTIRRQV
jgi:hypothetical protein